MSEIVPPGKRAFCPVAHNARNIVRTVAADTLHEIPVVQISPPRPPFPPDNLCFRGGGFDEQYRSFFVKGREFRQPAYFATSFSRAVADAFIARAVVASKVRWLVRIDDVRKCAHVNLVQKTNVPGEEEYLFAP